MSSNIKNSSLPAVNKNAATPNNSSHTSSKKTGTPAPVPTTISTNVPCPTKIVRPSNGKQGLANKSSAGKLPKIASSSKSAASGAPEKILKQTAETGAITAAAEAETDAKRLGEEEKKKLAEEARLAEETRLAEIKKQEEDAAAKKIRGNGDVTLIYERYDEKFPIVDGSTTAANIDEVYCLSFVMPNCVIHLSTYNPIEKRQLQIEGNIDYFMKEDPRGTFHDLEKDRTYYVYVEQEADQLARDQERQRRIATSMEGINEKGVKHNREQEGCSCLYGNPCMDEYICKDWHNRFSVARANGWKAFPGIDGT